jgi:hypothetical protein
VTAELIDVPTEVELVPGSVVVPGSAVVVLDTVALLPLELTELLPLVVAGSPLVVLMPSLPLPSLLPSVLPPSVMAAVLLSESPTLSSQAHAPATTRLIERSE